MARAAQIGVGYVEKIGMVYIFSDDEDVERLIVRPIKRDAEYRVRRESVQFRKQKKRKDASQSGHIGETRHPQDSVDTKLF